MSWHPIAITNNQDAKRRLDLLASRLQSLSVNVQQSTHGGGTWVSGMTCFTAMDDTERQKVLMKPGVLKLHRPANATASRPVNNKFASPSPSPSTPTPSALPPVDWRLVNGQSFVTPVRDQGDCGTAGVFVHTAGGLHTALRDITPLVLFHRLMLHFFSGCCHRVADDDQPPWRGVSQRRTKNQSC